MSVTVTNTGARAGDEVVQLYVSDREASVPVPIRKLVGFKRCSLEAGSSQKVSFTGEARIIGVENGNRRDHTKPTSIEKKAFNGMILGMIQSTNEPGDITVGVSSPGIKGAEVELVSVRE